jgi:Flp pilus assembly protein TadD
MRSGMRCFCFIAAVSLICLLIGPPVLAQTDQDLVIQGNQLLQKKNYSAAIEKFDQAIVLNRSNDAAFAGACNGYSHTSSSDRALLVCNKSLELNPEQPDLWNTYSSVQAGSGQYNESLDSADYAISCHSASNESRSESWRLKASAYYKIGNYGMTLSAANLSIANNSANFQGWNLKGCAWYSLGENQAALDMYEKAIKLAPDNDVLWDNKGKALSKLGRTSEAETAYTTAKALRGEITNQSPWMDYLIYGSALAGLVAVIVVIMKKTGNLSLQAASLRKPVRQSVPPLQDVFICHAPADRVFVESLCDSLEAKGVRCWNALRDLLPGSDAGGARLRAIETSRLIVVIVSGSANRDERLITEIDRATAVGVPVIPVKVENVAYSERLGFFLNPVPMFMLSEDPQQRISYLVDYVVSELAKLSGHEGRYDLFISFASEDRKKVDEIVALLEKKGITCFLAYRDIPSGQDFILTLLNAIRRSRYVLLVLSQNSNASSYVRNEIGHAAQNNVQRILFRIEDTEPSPSLAAYLGQSQWIDALSPYYNNPVNQLSDLVQPVSIRSTRNIPSGRSFSDIIRKIVAVFLDSMLVLVIILVLNTYNVQTIFGTDSTNIVFLMAGVGLPYFILPALIFRKRTAGEMLLKVTSYDQRERAVLAYEILVWGIVKTFVCFFCIMAVALLFSTIMK